MKTPSPRRPRLRRSRARVRYPDLASYIAATGDTQDHIAEKLGCAQAYVSRVATGRMVPRPEMALKLARYAHIPSTVSCWSTKRAGGWRKRWRDARTPLLHHRGDPREVADVEDDVQATAKGGQLPFLEELQPRLGGTPRYRAELVDRYLGGQWGQSTHFASHRRSA